MTFELTYKSNGDDVASDFGNLLNEVERPIRLLQAWKAYRTSEFNQQFARGTDPYGNTLAPLSSAYAAQKSMRFGGRPIRVASGDTKSSYTCEIVGNSVVETVGGAAQWLQEGTSRMPARKLLPDGDLPAKDQEKLLELVEKLISQTIRS